MKAFRMAGVAVALAALAACGGNSAEKGNAAADNVALETENLDLNATDLNAVDANAVDANAVNANAAVGNEVGSEANAADNVATNAQ